MIGLMDDVWQLDGDDRRAFGTLDEALDVDATVVFEAGPAPGTWRAHVIDAAASSHERA